MSGTSTPRKPKRDRATKAGGNGSGEVGVPGAVTIGQYLVERLGALGVEHVFGIPGDYILNFTS